MGAHGAQYAWPLRILFGRTHCNMFGMTLFSICINFFFLLLGAGSSSWSAIKSHNNSKGRLRGLRVDKPCFSKKFKISKISQEVDLWEAIINRFVGLCSFFLGKF
jgi:hypothetical protein